MAVARFDLRLEFIVLLLDGFFLEFELFELLEQILDLFLDLLDLALLLSEADVNGL